jgi:CHAD domain-containing protein
VLPGVCLTIPLGTAFQFRSAEETSRMQEREVKLGVPADFELPDLAGLGSEMLVEPQPVRRYRTTYYDTADLRLARWRCSLRYREGEQWTVKLAAGAEGESGRIGGGLLVRSEYRFDGKAGKPPADALDLVRAFIRTATVGPVARLRTVRRPLALRDAAGEQLAELVDDEVAVLDDKGRRTVDRFREIEVELTDRGTQAPPGTLERLVERLRDAGAGDPQVGSKYERALGDRAGAPPELAKWKLHRDASAEELLRLDLTAGTLRLFRHEAAARLGEDPEAVHQARVATRRLRSTLRTFSDVLEAAWTDRLRAELAWLAGRLGAVRDADVLLARLQGQLTHLPLRDAEPGLRLLGALVKERDAARADLLSAMGQARYAALLDDLVAAAQAPAVLPRAARPAAEVLPPLVAGPLKKLRRTVAGLAAEPSDADLHQVRIRAKRARYAVEAVGPVFGTQAGKLADAISDLQDVLGEQHDGVVAEEWLRQAAAGQDPDAVLVAGQLIALERLAMAAARGRWRAAWTAASRKRLRAWL